MSAERIIATVKRSGSPLGEVSVAYEVASLSASPGADYVAAEPGELVWADGDATARTIVVPLIEDSEEEIAEQFEIRLSSPTGATLADDRLRVDIRADGMAATGLMLFDDVTGQDLEPITQGKRLAPSAVPPDSGVRVEVHPRARGDEPAAEGVVRNSGGVESVGLTVDGADETHTDNDAPYVFHVLGGSPRGSYTLQATPCSEDDLGGESGQPLSVTFAVSDRPLSSDATLRDLETTGIGFDFAADTETYDVTVGSHPASTTVSPTTAAGATVEISPSDADLERSVHQVGLASGMNAIDIAVTAEDGEATRNYTVRVVRARFVTGP